MRLKSIVILIFLSSILFSCTLIRESRNRKKLANIEYERVYTEDTADQWNWDDELTDSKQSVASTPPNNTKNIIWYHPNPWWRIETTPFPVSKDSMKIRLFAPQYGFPHFYHPTSNTRQANIWQDWTNINHLNGYGNNASHIWQAFIKVNQSIFLEHPEYLAEKDGQRLGYSKINKLCVTNTQVQNLFIQYIRNNISSNPDRTVYSIEPSDGGNHCTCPNCSKLGSNSNKVFYFSNIIAKAIKKSHPQKQLAIYAYNEHALPPDFKIEDNIKVLVAPNGFQTDYPPLSFLNNWTKHHNNLGLREYLCIPQWKGEQPRTELSFFLQEFQHVKNNHYDMLVYEAGLNINNIIIATLLSKMFMNPSLSWDEVFNKFLNDCFKQSQEPIRRLLERWQTYIDYDPNDIHYSLYDLKEAFSLAKDEKEKSRIRDLMAYMHYIILYNQWNQDRNNSKSTNTLFEYLYNSNNRNIVNVKALISVFASTLKKQTGVYEKFTYEVATNKSWVKWITDQQIEKNFQLDLQKYAQKKFQLITYKELESEIQQRKIQQLNAYTLTLANKAKTKIYARSKSLKITPTFKGAKPDIAISICDKSGNFITEKVMKSNETWELTLPETGFYTISQYRIHSASLSLQGSFNVILEDKAPTITDKKSRVVNIKTKEFDQNSYSIIEPIY